MLRIRDLLGTQEEARPDRPGTMEVSGEARETWTQIDYRIVLFLLGAALLFGSGFTEPDLVSGLSISGLLTTAAGISLVIAYIIGNRIHRSGWPGCCSHKVIAHFLSTSIPRSSGNALDHWTIPVPIICSQILHWNEPEHQINWPPSE